MKDTRYAKRAQMWAKIQRRRKRELLDDRLRVQKTPQRHRIMRRKLNGFMASMPEYFRYTNVKPRPPKPTHGTDESSASSHGAFRYWNLPEDPEDDGE